MQTSSFKTIVTACGRDFVLSYLDQIAIGTFERAADSGEDPYIPSTFALYHTLDHTYIMEVTVYEPENNQLLTTYQIMPEAEAIRFLARNAPWKMGA